MGVFAFLETNAKKYTDISKFMILIKIGTILSFVLSVIFFKEIVTFKKIAAFVLILGTTLALIIRIYGFNFKIDRGFIFSSALGVILGIGWTLDKVAVTLWGAGLYAALAQSSSSLYVALVPPIKRTALLKQIKITKLPLVLLALINALGYFFFMKSMTVGEVSKVILVVNLNEILTIIGGIYILKEKEFAFEKILAGVIVLGASALLI